MHRNRSVDVHQFSMIPRADIPRSAFRTESAHKTTFDSGVLVPLYIDEVLPGDTHSLNMTIFVRMATPIVPFMDNLHVDSFFFFVPCRLVWDNWKKFMGEQKNPGDSTSYTVPLITTAVGGSVVNSLADYFGIPGVGQVDPGYGLYANALPFRAYNLIWNEWFRDENLQNSVTVPTGDGPDDYAATYTLLRRGKRHDYFSSCLPWTQKGTSVPLPLTGNAVVKGDANHLITGAAGTFPMLFRRSADGALPATGLSAAFDSTGRFGASTQAATGTPTPLYASNLYADLSSVTATTINQLRQSFQIQKLLERDARGGTRYTEIVRSHFGVISPDARLQRPEYLGGGSTPVSVQEIPQTSGTGASGTTSPLGMLAAKGTAVGQGHGFSQSFTEHGYIIGLVSVRADLAYQQGMRRLWSRRTRYDFYFPVFSALGEQAVTNKEIYCTGVGANDDAVFGYNERWSEYRYHPSLITGLFNSKRAGTLDVWHLAQNFTSLPTLNSTFIQDTPPVSRALAVSPSSGKEFLCDSFFQVRKVRPMPMYSVPGLVDHF